MKITFTKHIYIYICIERNIIMELKLTRLFLDHGCRAFWAGADTVVIEADAFKESDVIYRALSSRGHVDMIQTAELVKS